MGKPLLDDLGLKNRLLLSTFADQSGGIIDVPRAVQEFPSTNGLQGGSSWNVHRLSHLKCGEFGITDHNEWDMGTVFLEDSDAYVNIGEKDQKELADFI